MSSIEVNKTWAIVPLPKGEKTIASKWIYKFKGGIPGAQQPRFKARLFAKGFTQREGICYAEIFSPVVKHTSIRMFLAIVVHRDLTIEQLDVKTAFLHGFLKETIYLKQPEGYHKKGKEDQVCLLNKSLYGLKQSPRCW